MEKIKETYEKIGYKVIETQTKEKKGIEELKQALSKNINAFFRKFRSRKINTNKWNI